MYTDWQAAALSYIAEIHRSMPEATVDELRKELRRRAKSFHGGTSWGKKTWSKRCRLYLLSLGANLNPPAMPGEWPADIAFPWKGESDRASPDGRGS